MRTTQEQTHKSFLSHIYRIISPVLLCSVLWIGFAKENEREREHGLWWWAYGRAYALHTGPSWALPSDLPLFHAMHVLFIASMNGVLLCVFRCRAYCLPFHFALDIRTYTKSSSYDSIHCIDAEYIHWYLCHAIASAFIFLLQRTLFDR